jgi:hypothetical protein
VIDIRGNGKLWISGEIKARLKKGGEERQEAVVIMEVFGLELLKEVYYV